MTELNPDDRTIVAAMVFAAIIPGYSDCDPRHAEATAKAAVAFTDALIAELAKGPVP